MLEIIYGGLKYLDNQLNLEKNQGSLFFVYFPTLLLNQSGFPTTKESDWHCLRNFNFLKPNYKLFFVFRFSHSLLVERVPMLQTFFSSSLIFRHNKLVRLPINLLAVLKPNNRIICIVHFFVSLASLQWRKKLKFQSISQLCIIAITDSLN